MISEKDVLILGRDRLAKFLSAITYERSLVATVKPLGYNYDSPNDVWLFVETQDYTWSDYQVEGEEDATRVELFGAEATADFILALVNPFKKYQFSVWSSVLEEKVFIVYVADESKGLRIIDLAE